MLFSNLASPAPDVVRFLRTLADETRMTIVRLLALSDMRAGELVAQLRLPPNAVSYHLRQLRELGLLQDRRSSADARDVYYALDWHRLETLYVAVGQAFHPGYSTQLVVKPPHSALTRPLRVLFLCTHNSARSQLAEGLLRQLAPGTVEVFSAGTMPAEEVHPDVLALLADMGIDVARHIPKHVEQFRGQSFDFVVTVCDRARENCLAFPEQPLQIHWSFPDPLEVADDTVRRALLARLREEMLTRLRLLVALPAWTSGVAAGGPQ